MGKSDSALFEGQIHGFGFGSNPGSITVSVITEKQSGLFFEHVTGIAEVGSLGRK